MKSKNKLPLLTEPKPFHFKKNSNQKEDQDENGQELILNILPNSNKEFLTEDF